MSSTNTYLPSGLGRAQIGAENFGVREIVAHFNSPDSGAGSNVQDASRFANGRMIQLVAYGDGEHSMTEIQTILLAFVVRHDVASILEGVVASAIFDWISLNAAGQGCSIL